MTVAHLQGLQLLLEMSLTGLQGTDITFSCIQPLLCCIQLLLERVYLDIGLINDHLQLIAASLQDKCALSDSSCNAMMGSTRQPTYWHSQRSMRHA